MFGLFLKLYFTVSPKKTNFWKYALLFEIIRKRVRASMKTLKDEFIQYFAEFVDQNSNLKHEVKLLHFVDVVNTSIQSVELSNS